MRIFNEGMAAHWAKHCPKFWLGQNWTHPIPIQNNQGKGDPQGGHYVPLHSMVLIPVLALVLVFVQFNGFRWDLGCQPDKIVETGSLSELPIMTEWRLRDALHHWTWHWYFPTTRTNPVDYWHHLHWTRLFPGFVRYEIASWACKLLYAGVFWLTNHVQGQHPQNFKIPASG